MIGLGGGRFFARRIGRRRRRRGVCTCELGRLVGLLWVGSGAEPWAESDGEKEGFGGGGCVGGLVGDAWSTLTSIRIVRQEWTALE
jgi:hypothetical protein